MALTISTELQAILDGSVRTVHKTIAITFPTNPTLRFATAALTIDGDDYADDLRSVGEIRRTIENPVDRVAVGIQNVDRVIGQDLAANVDEWRLAEAVIGRHYEGSGETEWIEMFRGIVQQPTADDMSLRFDVVSDTVAKGEFIAARNLGPLCPFRFKDAATCGYSGGETACNHHLRSKDGCMGRDNEHRFGGTEHKYLPDASTPGTGANQGGGGLGTGNGGCPRLDQWILVEHPADGRPTAIRVRTLTRAYKIFNPIDGQFHKIRSLEVTKGQRIVYTVSGSGAECYSSNTHKLLWYREHVTGEVITNFVVDDPVLTWTRGHLADSRISVLRFDDSFGDVMKIEMESGHIYAAGADGRRFIVAHNTKNPIDPIEIPNEV